MSNTVYDILNKIQRWLPALGAFWLGLCEIWSLPYGNEINKTIAIIVTLMAATLEVFTSKWSKNHKITVTKINE